MKSSQLSSSIQWNNHAITLFNKGNNTDRAVAALTKALVSAKQAVVSLNQYSGPTNNETTLDKWMVDSKSLDEQKTKKIDDFREEDYFIYRRPIIIPNNMVSLNHESNRKILAVILFNLALVHQVEGMKDGIPTNDCRRFLRKAGSLFELSYSMNDVVSANVLFTMTIMNNLGFVYQSLGKGVKAEECFTYLLSTLMLVTDCGHGIVISDFVDGLFFRSISHLISKPITASAA